MDDIWRGVSWIQSVFRPAPENLAGVADANKRFSEGFDLHPGADIDVLFDHSKLHFAAVEAGRKSIEEKAEKLISLNLTLAGALIAALKLASVKGWQTWPALCCFLIAVIAASLSRRTLTWNLPSSPWLLVKDWKLGTKQAKLFLASSFALAGFICKRQLEWRSYWHAVALWATLLGVALIGLLIF